MRIRLRQTGPLVPHARGRSGASLGRSNSAVTPTCVKQRGTPVLLPALFMVPIIRVREITVQHRVHPPLQQLRSRGSHGEQQHQRDELAPHDQTFMTPARQRVKAMPADALDDSKIAAVATLRALPPGSGRGFPNRATTVDFLPPVVISWYSRCAITCVSVSFLGTLTVPPRLAFAIAPPAAAPSRVLGTRRVRTCTSKTVWRSGGFAGRWLLAPQPRDKRLRPDVAITPAPGATGPCRGRTSGGSRTRPRSRASTCGAAP